MKTKILSKLFGSITMPLALIACVTINIYFPAAAAEKAADRIIEDVWGKQPGAAKPVPKAPAAPKASEKSSRNDGAASDPLALTLLNLLISPAQAAEEADINIATPAIDSLRASMKARHVALEPHYNSGAVGLTNDALVAEHNAGAIPLKDRNSVKQLVADENKDRNALYREIVQVNNHPEWEADIRKTFAKQWVENARAGWWYQDDSGAWKQK
ncbi:MAG: YdbL family protein [Gammaproteobacteria bacterium]